MTLPDRELEGFCVEDVVATAGRVGREDENEFQFDGCTVAFLPCACVYAARFRSCRGCDCDACDTCDVEPVDAVGFSG